MSYEKTVWVDGSTALSAEHMNKIENELEDLDANKVDKETGKSLTSNDFTNAYKTKLDGMDAGAQKIYFKSIESTESVTIGAGNSTSFEISMGFNLASIVGIRELAFFRTEEGFYVKARVCISGWDMSGTRLNVKVENRTSASITITKAKVSFSYIQ